MPLKSDTSSTGMGSPSPGLWSFAVACTKSSPSAVRSSANPTAPARSEASVQTIYLAIVAPRLQCTRGEHSNRPSNSPLARLTNSWLIFWFPLVTFQISCRKPIAGLLNCSAKIHRPAMIWAFFLSIPGATSVHSVAMASLCSFWVGTPSNAKFPSTSAPSSWM